MAQQMPLPLTISCCNKSRLVLPFWYQLTRVVPDKFQKSCKTIVVVVVYACIPAANVLFLVFTECDSRIQNVRKADDDILAMDADSHSQQESPFHPTDLGDSRSLIESTSDPTTSLGDGAQPSGKDGFRCPVCDKRFQSSHMQRHMRVHSGERPYACGVCHLQFSQPANLTRHMTVVHAGERRYSCDVCARTFTSSSNMKVRRRNRCCLGFTSPPECRGTTLWFKSWRVDRDIGI